MEFVMTHGPYRKTKKGKRSVEKTELIVEEGSYVYCSQGDFYAEWDSLSERQQQAFLDAKNELGTVIGRVTLILSLAYDNVPGPRDSIARPYLPHKLTETERQVADSGLKP